jgi:hypothetical protein
MAREKTAEDRVIQDAPTDLHDLLRRDPEGYTALERSAVCAGIRSYVQKLSEARASGKRPNQKRAAPVAKAEE